VRDDAGEFVLKIEELPAGSVAILELHENVYVTLGPEVLPQKARLRM
jgi:hypothetical protein